MFRFVFSFLCFSFVFARHEKYDGHAVFSVKIKDADQAKYFNTLEYPLDIWQYAAPGSDGMVLVPKDYIHQFQNELYSEGMEFILEVENIKDSLDLEDKLLAEASLKTPVKYSGPTLPLFRIPNLEEVDTYLKEVAEAYPDVVTLVNGGQSVEGRDINYLKISTTNFEDTSKPIIFIESLLHAREWITLPASLYAIQKLVVNVTEPDLLDEFDWIILPVANPDGYDFSHKRDRFWRKNRRLGLMPNDVCAGVDLNRNFDVFFGVAGSNNVCYEIYQGPHAFSEPEAQVVRDILHEYSERTELFLDLHSFGSMILYGWGTGTLPPNAFALQVGAVEMARAIDAVKLAGYPNYRVGNIAMILYRASGTATDYGKTAGVPLSYTYELPAFRGFAGTILGFLVDPRFIGQASFETWEGIKAGARFARRIMNQRY